ncbi:hypothetical protein FQA39_LY08724 [Lamprigera yunnana]|nr:hypothetical protein FQA39_LY08724 [Lamprigera yunnana]
MQHNTGSPQQFCLRWNNYQSNLTNVFDQLLQSESFVDVTLACDGHSVKAHKMVLSACSPYFQSLFFDNPCQHPIVIMRDIKWPELKAAVEFMYKGEINVSQEQIGPLLRVAESLKIRGLADVNGEQDIVSPTAGELTSTKTLSKSVNITDWESRQDGEMQPRAKKRRRPSGERSSLSSPAESGNTDMPEPPPSVEMSPAPSATPLPTPGAAEPLPLTLPLPTQQQISQSHPDDMEIKPGIAEMIREEERTHTLMDNRQICRSTKKRQTPKNKVITGGRKKVMECKPILDGPKLYDTVGQYKTRHQPVSMKEDKATYREQFVPPEMSMLAYLLTKPDAGPNCDDVSSDSESEEEDVFDAPPVIATNNCEHSNIICCFHNVSFFEEISVLCLNFLQFSNPKGTIT